MLEFSFFPLGLCLFFLSHLTQATSDSLLQGSDVVNLI